MPRALAHQKYHSLTKSGIRAQIRIHGILHRKHFKTGTDPVTIKQWVLAQEIKYRRTGTRQAGTFAADAARYLAAVTAMPTYTERKQHIEEWIAVFQSTWRGEITSDQIRAQLHAWRAAGKAASTVNHRRTALMHLFTVLDGKAAANPVKDVPRFREPSPAPRSLPPAKVARLLKKLTGADRARASVIAYTGIPHAQLGQVRLEDVDWKRGTVTLHGRKKGAGTAASVRPLTAQGLAAFRLMKAAKCWGPFDRWAFRKAIRAACKAARVPIIRPYDLRHFFGTELYRRSGDVRAVQILMGHSTPTLTHRYTIGAVDPRVAAAVKAWK